MRKSTLWYIAHFVNRAVNAKISYPTAKIIFLHIYKLQYLTCLESKLQSPARCSSRRLSSDVYPAQEACDHLWVVWIIFIPYSLTQRLVFVSVTVFIRFGFVLTTSCFLFLLFFSLFLLFLPFFLLLFSTS